FGLRSRSGLPNEAVQVKQELPHARDEGQLLWLSRGDEAYVEGLDVGVVPGRRHGGHVERSPDWLPSSMHEATTDPLTALSGERSEACESCDLLAVQVA